MPLQLEYMFSKARGSVLFAAVCWGNMYLINDLQVAGQASMWMSTRHCALVYSNGDAVSWVCLLAHWTILGEKFWKCDSDSLFQRGLWNEVWVKPRGYSAMVGKRRRHCFPPLQPSSSWGKIPKPITSAILQVIRGSMVDLGCQKTKQMWSSNYLLHGNCIQPWAEPSILPAGQWVRRGSSQHRKGVNFVSAFRRNDFAG